MKIIYPLIPRVYRWFYPEGNIAADEPHTELHNRAAAGIEAREVAPAEMQLLLEDQATQLGQLELQLQVKLLLLLEAKGPAK